jgi:hypothetical protein
MPAWLAALDALLTQAEALADADDERSREVAQRARNVRLRRPKGT